MLLLKQYATDVLYIIPYYMKRKVDAHEKLKRTLLCFSQKDIEILIYHQLSCQVYINFFLYGCVFCLFPNVILTPLQ